MIFKYTIDGIDITNFIKTQDTIFTMEVEADFLEFKTNSKNYTLYKNSLVTCDYTLIDKEFKIYLRDNLVYTGKISEINYNHKDTDNDYLDIETEYIDKEIYETDITDMSGQDTCENILNKLGVDIEIDLADNPYYKYYHIKTVKSSGTGDLFTDLRAIRPLFDWTTISIIYFQGGRQKNLISFVTTESPSFGIKEEADYISYFQKILEISDAPYQLWESITVENVIKFDKFCYILATPTLKRNGTQSTRIYKATLVQSDNIYYQIESKKIKDILKPLAITQDFIFWVDPNKTLKIYSSDKLISGIELIQSNVIELTQVNGKKEIKLSFDDTFPIAPNVQIELQNQVDSITNENYMEYQITYLTTATNFLMKNIMIDSINYGLCISCEYYEDYVKLKTRTARQLFDRATEFLNPVN